MKATPARFIAGAVCPRCGEMDKIRAYRSGENGYRECVACGFEDEQRFDPVPRELETRVNVTPEQKSAQTQVVKILKPGGDS